ncbi:unnamed protein product, partial [Ixodes persulcatus]
VPGGRSTHSYSSPPLGRFSSPPRPRSPESPPPARKGAAHGTGCSRRRALHQIRPPAAGRRSRFVDVTPEAPPYLNAPVGPQPSQPQETASGKAARAAGLALQSRRKRKRSQAEI